jgi:hypothetical protein
MAAQLGKLTVKNLSSFNNEVHVKVTDLQRNIVDRSGNVVTTFHIPQTKVMPKEKGGEIVFWARQDGPTDPDAALTSHVELNEPPL